MNEDEVKLPENRAASECLGQVADFLFVNGYLELDDLPIKSGHKRYLVNTKPKHQSGDKMFRPKPIAQGLYVETNYNKDGIKRKIEDLI